MSPTTLITGATRGIGCAIATTLLREGHNIINISRTGGIPRQFVKYGPDRFTSFNCDISDMTATHQLTSDIIKRTQINNIILNSGITKDRMFYKMSPNDWSDVINTNLTSVYGVLHPVINQMRMHDGINNVIFISSVNAHRGVLGQTNYSASKGGLLSLNRCLAAENADKGIKCNVISPGYIETDMIQSLSPKIRKHIESDILLKRFGSPSDVSELVKLLTSDNHYFQGANFDMNGGLLMR